MNSLPTNTQKCTRHSYNYYCTSNVVPAYIMQYHVFPYDILCTYMYVCVCVYRSAVRNVMALKLYLLFCELLMDCLVKQTRFSKLKGCGGRVNYRAILTISCDMQYTHLLAVTHTHTHSLADTHIHTHTHRHIHLCLHMDTHMPHTHTHTQPHVYTLYPYS